MKKLLCLGLLAGLLTLLIGCGTTSRYNTFVPMSQSCFVSGVIIKFDGETYHGGVEHIIPAGLHMLVIPSGGFWGDRQEEVIFNFEAGKKYKISDYGLIYEDTGRLGKTYFSQEGSFVTHLGIRNPGIFGASIGPTYGFGFFSNLINVHVYGEAGIGIGLGVPNYDFAWENIRGEIPILHCGGTVELEIGKWGMGFGGGYLNTITTWGNPYENYATPYLQLLLGRSAGKSIYIDYCPIAEPLYSAFGLGIKTVL